MDIHAFSARMAGVGLVHPYCDKRHDWQVYFGTSRALRRRPCEPA